jgi:hypothetical protein
LKRKRNWRFNYKAKRPNNQEIIFLIPNGH